LPFKVKQRTDSKTILMQKLAEFVVSKYRILLWTMGAVIFVFIAIIPVNDVNDRFVEYFDESVEFRQHSDYVSEKLTGLYTVDISLQAEESGGINEPKFIASMNEFSEWLRAQPEVVHVNSVSDTYKRLNKNMHGDDESFYSLPDSRELAAQYLLLYELSLPYGLDLNNQVNIDKTSTRISVTVDTLSTKKMLEFEESARDWVENNTQDINIVASSPAVIFSHLAVRNIYSMIIGTMIALALISVILIFALRSFKLGMLSLVPNLLPIGVAFGVWAIFDSEIGLALSIVAGMTLGIVVDDTVHFMSKYLRAKREKNLSARDAVRYAFENVGTALLVTTLVLAAGFMVLSLSSFELNSAMGLLTAITIVIALIIDFLFLPPLLIALEEGRNEKDISSDMATAN
jgi:predicted RND superfamily exporter protein